MATALRFPHDQDISSLRRALWAHRIGHHFTTDEESQIVVLLDDAQQSQAMELVERWQRGETLMPRGPVARSPGVLKSAFTRAPLTTLTILACVLVFALMAVLGDAVVTALTIVPIDIDLDGERLIFGDLSSALVDGQVWRLLSPVMLHFGWMHLIFNMLWLWYFGRQIEARQGASRFLLLLVISGVVANLAQYATGTMLFGGMSGVDYALLGYVWLYAKLRPSSGFFLPQMLIVFMLAWLVLCMTPLAGYIGFGNVANEAHLGGLLTGLGVAWLMTKLAPTPRR